MKNPEKLLKMLMQSEVHHSLTSEDIKALFGYTEKHCRNALLYISDFDIIKDTLKAIYNGDYKKTSGQ